MSKKLDELLKQLLNLHPKYIDLSLDRLRKLLKNLGNPENSLPPIIHIAGTNGKGSTLSFIRNILIEHNLKVHAYISPHLKDFNERIIISNKEIQTNKLKNTLELVKKINNKKPITFFEITTAAAFYSTVAAPWTWTRTWTWTWTSKYRFDRIATGCEAIATTSTNNGNAIRMYTCYDDCEQSH